VKACVYGLGAIGGLIAARLARAGHPVSAVARGATLEAVRRDGLTLVERDGEGERRTSVRIDASDRPGDLGPQPLVILSVKTTALAQVAREIGPLIGPDTVVLSTMNGLQWWFFHGMGPELGRIRLDSVDPGGALAEAIPAPRVVGCVTHLSSSTSAPGVVRHGVGDRLIVGEPGGGASERSRAIAALLSSAGFEVESSERIQRDVWIKLWGNMTVNPVSALTGATADRMLDDELVRGYLSRCMVEAARIGERIGLPIAMTPDERHAITRKLGALRTSMLQDVEAGRAIELDALVASVVEIGRQVRVETPAIDALLGLSRLFGRVHGLYPESA
jgi:2-dehydropantoate 2-reductase